MTIFKTYPGYYKFSIIFFGATTPNYLYGFDEPQTPFASPSEGRVLSTRAQPGVGFAAPWRLAFSAVLRTDIAA